MEDETFFGITATSMVIAFVCGMALLAWGGYELGWWLEEDRVNRSAEISDNSVNRESALREDALDHHDTVLRLRATHASASDEQKPTLEAQITASLDRFCDSYGQIDNLQLPDSVNEFADKEC